MWEQLIQARPLLSLAAVVLTFIVTALIERAVRRIPVSPPQRRRAVRLARTGGLLLLALLLAVVWAQELRNAAIVLSALAVAIVIGFKEIMACALGWWIKMAGGHFRVGDRVAISSTAGPVRGDVLDYGLLTTTLMEV